MTPVACRYCGLPFKVRRVEPQKDYFCCTGCAILARVPVDAQGQFPVNAHLIGALAVGFVFFNQLLFWALAQLLARDAAQAATVERLLWFAAGAGALTWLALAWMNFRENVRRVGDLVAASLALAAHVYALATSHPPSAAIMAASNALLLAWNLRGAWRGKKSGGK